MNSRVVFLPVVFALAAAIALADDAPPVPSAHDILRAQLAQQAKDQAAGKPTAPLPAPVLPPPAPPADTNPLLAKPAPADAQAAESSSTAKNETPTLMPKVEVRKERITKLDVELAKQDEAIAREKRLTKASEVDQALNNDKLAKPLAIFGGESADYRTGIASQRVSMMEDEKTLIEAIAHAKTKPEKAELQRQLDILRQARRELEQSLR